MFNPNYTIIPKLLENIKRISSIVTELNAKTFPHVVLQQFEYEARNLSAHASTSIEGNPLPLTDVKKLLKSKPKYLRDTEREVLNYNNALLWLNKKCKKLDTIPINHALIHQIYTLVMEGLMSMVRLKSYRNEPVFVNDPRTGKTVYWPPDHQDVQKLMDDLLQFVSNNNNRLDALIVAGIFHKQFVIIHPFLDGNGRTVRLLTKAILADMGLDTFNLFSFENYYNTNVTQYFTYVGGQGNYYDMVKHINFTDWLVYFTGGIVDELLRVQKELEKAMVSPKTTLSKDQQALIDYIDKSGFITDKIYSTLTKRAKATRNLDFQKLISLKIIKREGKGKATYYKRR